MLRTPNLSSELPPSTHTHNAPFLPHPFYKNGHNTGRCTPVLLSPWPNIARGKGMRFFVGAHSPLPAPGGRPWNPSRFLRLGGWGAAYGHATRRASGERRAAFNRIFSSGFVMPVSLAQARGRLLIRPRLANTPVRAPYMHAAQPRGFFGPQHPFLSISIPMGRAPVGRAGDSFLKRRNLH